MLIWIKDCHRTGVGRSPTDGQGQPVIAGALGIAMKVSLNGRKIGQVRAICLTARESDLEVGEKAIALNDPAALIWSKAMEACLKQSNLWLRATG